jgi:uncharacterized RDD family membrane protein YckC
LSPSSQNVGENLTHAGAEVVPAWKKELNERLAATRSRRSRNREQQVALPGMGHIERKVESRASLLAAKVAQRYANAPSYSEVLFAAEARAKAQTATAVAPAVEETPFPLQPLPESWHDSLAAETVDDRPAPNTAVGAQFPSTKEACEESAIAVFEPLEVNLIEFPRELVAPRKVRPRLAEGPLRESSQEVEHDQSQLKIFEVAPESISQTVSIAATGAEWSPIRLEIDPIAPLVTEARLRSQQIPLKTASLEDRLMAGIFDLALIVAAFAIFVLVFAACTAHPPAGKAALLGAGLILGGFCLLYQFLFFKYAEGTPGMRYAKIALCTFEDENPTRQAMCRRVLFVLLSAAPLGLGFLWACFDPDRLGWHDRLSRIYQRSYS